MKYGARNKITAKVTSIKSDEIMSLLKFEAVGSPQLASVLTTESLEAKGVHLIVCSTCLNYLGLREKVAVGIVGGMHDILVAQWQAAKFITL